MSRKQNPDKLCDVHKSKGQHPSRYCYACFRCNLNVVNYRLLKKLFPEIMKEEKHEKEPK